MSGKISNPNRIIIDLLTRAKGGLVTAQQIEAALGAKPRTGGRYIDNLRKARPDLRIENERGSGYRLLQAQPLAPAPAPVAAPESTVAAASLPASLASLKRALDAGNGQFVPGQVLARACGVPMPFLHNMIKALRNAAPDMAIEGKRGCGYRIIVRGVSLAVPPALRDQRGSAPMHVRMAQTMAMLDLLPAKSAEIVKAVALESGETPDEAIARLIAYGCEVHRDLVASGENPCGLRSMTAVMSSGPRSRGVAA